MGQAQHRGAPRDRWRHDGGEAAAPTDVDRNRASDTHECGEGLGRVHEAPGRRFIERQVAQAQQQIVDAVDGLHALRVAEQLQLAFDVRECVRIEQLPQLRFAEQLSQLRLIDREGLRAPLGQRCIAVVDVVGHVTEEERRRER